MQLIQSSLVHKVIPPTETGAERSPILILLHGRGADENDLLGLAPHLDPCFFVVSVRAPFQFAWGGYTWYDLQEVGTPHASQFTESYDRLARFVGDVKEHYPVDPAKTFLLGFSMGSVMSFALSLSAPSEIKGVVAHSGYIPESASLNFHWDELDQTAFFVAHGTHDPVIPVDFGRRAQALLSKTNAPFTYREYPFGHQISQESLRDFSAWLKGRLIDLH